MWLLDTKNMELHEFYGNIPSYAILSHRWEKEELSFENIDLPSSRNLRGYRKVEDFCKEARQRGFEYAWVDTCCINKLSSAELNEAINSMYKWYEEAAVCYVYLWDVDQLQDLKKSSWFTRGWTLQELLAPTKVYFFTRTWEFLASRQKLAPDLENITGISCDVLCKSKSIAEFCVAERMSWSANRATTRVEDRAYCLLGIFDVNMPLLYGEGEKAFQRLQEEIMKVSTDLSLFLWQGRPCNRFGMLAADPSCFVELPSCLKEPVVRKSCMLSEGWTVNNAAMSIRAVIQPYCLAGEYDEIHVLFLHEPYTFPTAPGLCIFLEKKETHRASSSLYRRIQLANKTWTTLDWCDRFHDFSFHSSLGEQNILITREPIVRTTSSLSHGINVLLKATTTVTSTARIRDPDNLEIALRRWPLQAPEFSPDIHHRYCFTVEKHRKAVGILGHLTLAVAEGMEILICLGLDEMFHPMCIIVFFCERKYDEGLLPSSVLHVYSKLLPRDRTRNQTFDQKTQIFAARGQKGPRKFENSFNNVNGLQVQLKYDEYVAIGMYGAVISFNPWVFLESYVPHLDLTGLDTHDGLSKSSVNQILAFESILHERRRDLL